MRQICIRLEETMIETLESLAINENKTMAALVRVILQGAIDSKLVNINKNPDEKYKKNIQKTQFKMLLQVLGLVRFLASRIDESVVTEVVKKSEEVEEMFL